MDIFYYKFSQFTTAFAKISRKRGEVYIFCYSVGVGSPVQATAANTSVRSKHFVEKRAHG